MKLSGVIFDLNGTIINDDFVWTKVYGMVLKTFGIDDAKEGNHICGMTIDRNWEILLKKHNIKTDKTPQELSAITNREYLKHLNEIQINEGFEELIRELDDTEIPIGLATSSYWEMVDKTLNTLGIEGYFDFITTGEEVKNSKPSPEIFEVTAEKMGVDPSECLVFEDSETGIEAALAAGMKVVGVYRDEAHKKKLVDADKTIANFRVATPELIAEISSGGK